jgi:hypothetical protein
MLASSLGKQILNGFLKNKKDDVVNFGITDIYLGLLTTLPQNNEQAYADGSFFKEPDDPNYHRIKLTDKNPFTESNYMQAARSGDVIEVSDGVYALPAYVTNQAIIMFEESSTNWGEVAGFGIFKENEGKNLPIIWGAITAEDGESEVTVGQYEIPIIRVNGFKVSLV